MGSQLIYRFVFMALVMMVSTAMVAQPDLPMTNDAAKFYQSGDLVSARNIINEATLSSSEKNHPYAWFVRGFVYKEFYKQVDNQFESSENREIAVESIARSIELDETKEYLGNNQKAIEFLADSYYNDAVRATNSLSEDNVDQPEFFYFKYKSTLQLIKPNQDFSKTDLLFYKSLAKGHSKIYIKDLENNVVYINKAIDLYKKALEIDPDDYESNYNLAISYYNQGVHKIRKVNHNTDIFELIIIQDQCVELFRSSLPFMQKAHEMKPNRTETLKGLIAIYYSLSDMEKSNHYKSTLLRLVEEGKIEE